MKITKSKLNQIIKEEIEQLVRGRSNISLSSDQAQNIRQTQNRAKKIIRLLSSTDPGNVELGLSILDTLKNQQLIDTIASYIVFRSDGRITIRGFKTPNETLEMILNYFAEKSVHVKDMLAQIENLMIYFNNFITNVDFLRFCTNLTTLNLYDCSSLQNVNGLQGLTNLMWLNLSDCISLQNVDGLKECTNLMYLNLSYCSSLQNVDGLEGCTNLTSLDLSWCKSLQNVDGLEGLTNLTTLSLEGCSSLENVDTLQGLTNLTSLDLGGCWSLQNVDALQGLTNLTYLELGWCTSLPLELQELFESNEYGTAYEQFMKALNASKGNQP